jgi:putative ABC transport system permease protein
VATSPHHLGATMVDERTHRMTELFGRLAPGATVEAARAELVGRHAAMMRKHPEAYAAGANVQLSVTPLRDQITAPARPVLLLLLAAAATVFAIACANVANLILARTVRREHELLVRAALGAGTGALRRILLAESLVLCSAGALLGVLLARPLVSVVARYAARFSVRALDVTVDPSLLWVGTGLAVTAAVVLAYVPRLPSPHAPSRSGSASAGLRITPGTNRRLRAFAVAQVALSFVLVTAAGMLVAALVALHSARAGFDTRQVLALDVPLPLEAGTKAIDFFQEAMRRIGSLPDVRSVAVGSFVPWRDAASLLTRFPFTVEGYDRSAGEEDPHAHLRIVTPAFFAALGIPLVAGRDFTDEDRRDTEGVVIVSRSVAQRMFAKGDAVGRLLWWTEPMFENRPRRIVGVVADVDDENVVPAPALTVYHPLRQVPYGSRVFVRAVGDPYALVSPVTRIIREMSADQPVDRPATLADVRAGLLAPERLNAFVLSGFAGVALLIAVVGVAGVLAFSVSARTREFGVRLAVGSAPRQLLAQVLAEGAAIAAIGIVTGAAGGYALGRVAAGSVKGLGLPGALAVLGAAAVIMGAAVLASLMPAARASRVDVVQALRSE